MAIALSYPYWVDTLKWVEKNGSTQVERDTARFALALMDATKETPEAIEFYAARARKAMSNE